MKHGFRKPFLTLYFPYDEVMESEVYAVIDIKSFYASCECAARGLDPFTTPLVVADKSRSVNSIVMSATPYLKTRYRIPNVCRIQDLPNIEEMIYATPRMSYYVEMSANIVSLFLDFVAEEDLHVYSIDESFLRLTPYLKMNGCDAFGFVAKIQEAIKARFGLVATAGLGPNMFLAKACLDNEGKKKPPYRAYWGYEDIQTKLWKVTPITKVWGIAHGIGSHLHRIGIRSMEALAKASPALIEKEFGIVGLDLQLLANGIDHTDITHKYVPKETSFSQGQVLMRDYTPVEAALVLKEIVDELCIRLRAANAQTKVVSLFVGYSSMGGGGGLHHQCALNVAADDNDILNDLVQQLYARYIEPRPIRNLVVSFGKLSCYDAPRQQSIFDREEELQERRSLRLAMDKISERFGRNAILRASALLKHSTIMDRHGLIGGHRA